MTSGTIPTTPDQRRRLHKEQDEEGNVHLTPLPRAKLIRDARQDRTWRWYIELAVPASPGGGIVRERLDQTEADSKLGFHRAEHLRMVPEPDPDWRGLMGHRPDSESGNRVLDDSFWRERAHSVGAPSQHLDLFAHMIHRNNRAAEIHRRRQAAAAPIAA